MIFGRLVHNGFLPADRRLTRVQQQHVHNAAQFGSDSGELSHLVDGRTEKRMSIDPMTVGSLRLGPGRLLDRSQVVLADSRKALSARHNSATQDGSSLGGGVNGSVLANSVQKSTEAILERKGDLKHG